MQQLLDVTHSIWSWVAFQPESLWANVLVLAGALVITLVAAARAQRHQIDHRIVHNQILLGLIILIAIAGHGLVVWLTAQPLAAASVVEGRWLTPLSGVSASIVAVVAVLAVTSRPPRRPSVLVWLDVAAPPALLGQALVPWAILALKNVRAQQPGVGLWSAQQPTLVASAVLPETLWHLTALALIVWIERLARGRLLPGDVALLYGILYGVGCTLSGSPGAVIVQSVGICIAGLCALLLLHRHPVSSALSALPGKQ